MVHSDIQLTPEVKEAFEEFRVEPGAFGAMYVRPNGAGWGWHSGMLTHEEAKQLAKTGCDVTTGRKCVLYAALEPITPAPKGALLQSMERAIVEAKREISPEDYIVVSATPAANWNVSWGYSDLSEAKAISLQRCKMEVDKFRQERAKNEVKARVDANFEKAGYFNCRIVGIYRKQN